MRYFPIKSLSNAQRRPRHKAACKAKFQLYTHETSNKKQCVTPENNWAKDRERGKCRGYNQKRVVQMNVNWSWIFTKTQKGRHMLQEYLHRILSASTEKQKLYSNIDKLEDGAYYCYCAYVLRISRYSDFLSPMLTNTRIILRGLKLSGESIS